MVHRIPTEPPGCDPPFNGEGDIINLTSGKPSLLTVPATVTIAQGSPVWPAAVSFPVSTFPVQTVTTVPVAATLGTSSLTVLVTLTPAPPAVLTGTTVTQEVSAGNPYSGTLTFNGPLPFGGATVTLVSDNPAALPVPATVTAAQGQTSVSFSGVAGAVTSGTTAHITATYNGVSLTAPIIVDTKPPVTITLAEYDTISLVLKVEATTTVPNSTLSFGTDPTLGPIGPMSLSGSTWSASVKATAPAPVTVWNSNGGSVSMAPTLRAK